MWQRLKNIYHLAQALAAALYYNFPSKKIIVIGVTGTDGKTTTVNMIYQILRENGQKVSIISSVNAVIGSKIYDTGLHVTTPSPWKVQKYLRFALDSGSKYIVLEATSHGLDQNRLAFVDFKIAAVTNITHEHLDYHKSWKGYANSKAKLFENVDFSALNQDDKSYMFLKDRAGGQLITYGVDKTADINPTNYKFKLKILGGYNLSNALAAAAVCACLEIKKSIIIKALNNFSKITGRMEEINLEQDFRVFVDFAHTPNSLKQALMSLKSQLLAENARLIAVFGSAGQRDRTKRPLMGKVAAEIADLIVLTAEDPRTEEVANICHQIERGFKNKKLGKDYFIISDRQEAIKFAINEAKENDIVGTFGKGHEKSMCFGNKEYPWDEFAAIKLAVEQKQKVLN